MKKILFLLFLTCGVLWGAPTDIVIPQYDANNLPQPITITGSGNTNEVLALNGSGILTSLSGGSITIDASGFNGALTTGDDTLQEVAQKLDDVQTAIEAMSLTFGSVNVTTLTATNYEVGAAAIDSTLSRLSAGDLGVEGNRIFRVGGADVPVADGGTGLSSGTSGGILYYSATGTLASSGLLAANALVIGGGAGTTPSTTTTGTGVLTALGINVGSTGAFVTNGGALGSPSSAGTLPAFTLGGIATLAEESVTLLDNAIGTTDRATGEAIDGTAGAALAYGDLIVLDVTDSRWELADANSAAAADGDSRGLIGLCILAAAGDGSATRILLRGTVRADTAFPAITVGAPLYISETAGDITHTSPTTEDNVVRVVGFGMASGSGDSIYFHPAGSWITYDVP